MLLLLSLGENGNMIQIGTHGYQVEKWWTVVVSYDVNMAKHHLILCRPLLLLPSIFPSIRAFSNESALPIRWPKDWSFSFNISLSNEYSGLISFRMD